MPGVFANRIIVRQKQGCDEQTRSAYDVQGTSTSNLFRRYDLIANEETVGWDINRIFFAWKSMAKFARCALARIFLFSAADLSSRASKFEFIISRRKKRALMLKTLQAYVRRSVCICLLRFEKYLRHYFSPSRLRFPLSREIPRYGFGFMTPLASLSTADSTQLRPSKEVRRGLNLHTLRTPCAPFSISALNENTVYHYVTRAR